MFSILFHTYAFKYTAKKWHYEDFHFSSCRQFCECILGIKKNAIQIFIVWCGHGSFCFIGYLRAKCNLMYR